MIEVRQTDQGDPLAFDVRVREGAGDSHHKVTMARAHHERLTGGRHGPEETVEAMFRFLLDREPKEAIMESFDATVVSRYFPEFEEALPGYLDAS